MVDATVERRRAVRAVVLIAPMPTIGVIAAMWLWPGIVGTIIFMLSKIWILALPLVWRLLIDRERISFSPARQGGFLIAGSLGIAISAIIIAAYWFIARDWIDVEHVRAMAEQNGIGKPERFLAAAAYWILINSVLEEYVFRWFIFRKCEALMPALAAVFVSALIFTVHHIIALRLQFDWRITILASLGIFIGGAVWSWLYLRYRSIWPGYLSHAIVDIAVFGLGWWIIFVS